jgi:hypothetical protein
LGSINILTKYETDTSMRLEASLPLGFNPLGGDPVIEVRTQEPNPGSPELHERNAPLLHQTTHESFGASQLLRDRTDV